MAMVQMVPVFVSSPDDVSAERNAAIDTVRVLDPVFTKKFGVSVRAVDWHTFAPIAERSPMRSFQNRILDEIRPESLFVGIFGKKYGSPVGRDGLSGTHTEIRFAVKHRLRIKIMQYFRRVKQAKLNAEIIEDIAKIRDVKREFREENLAYQEYTSGSSFRRRIVGDLLDGLLELIFETEAQRRKNLTEFFRLGRTAKETSPSVRLVCPQIHKHESGYSRPDYDWQERLLPNVVYEDFRAVEKIRTALRDIRVHDLVVQPPVLLVDGPKGNRIWLCIPRNNLAQAQLQELGDRVRFKIESCKGSARLIHWKREGEELIIHSPLEKYLKLSRPEAAVDQPKPWDLTYGKMYGVDYAVIARFNVGTMDNRTHPDWPFFHYYVAGIRGLGTWGAGWFIDHHPERLADLSRSAEQTKTDLQILLRVEYADYQIIHVEEVSDQPATYFNEQYSDESVRRLTDEYRSHWGS